MTLQGTSGLTDQLSGSLAELSDVTLTSPQNGQGLVYDGTEWVNQNIGSGSVTSIAVSGGNGIQVAGSPVTSAGTITLGLGAITPISISTGAGAFSSVVSANAGLVATTGSFSGVVSANAGVKTTTGGFSGLLTGSTATFSGLVSANAGIRSTTASFSGLLTGSTATFSGIVSANAGVVATTGSYSGVVSANAGIKSTTATFSGLVSADGGLNTQALSATTGSFTDVVSAALGINTTSVSAVTGSFTGGSLTISGAQTAASWTSTGQQFAVAAATLTDNTGSGPIGSRVATSLGIPTFAASAAVTISKAMTFFINGPPTAGTNTTITQGWSMFVNTGNAGFGAGIGIGAAFAAGLTSIFDIAANPNVASWTTQGALMGIRAGTCTDLTGSGPVATRVAVSIGRPTFDSSAAVTVTNASTLYIANAPLGTANTTLTNAWALFIAAGNASVAGSVTASSFIGAVSGNASTATALQNARTINGTSFDGTANISVPVSSSQISDAGAVGVQLLKTATTAAAQNALGAGAFGVQMLATATTAAAQALIGGGSGTVTSVAVSGKNGIQVAGSPVTTSGTIDLALGNITPTTISTGIVSASTVNVTGDIQAVTGRVTASAATFSALLSGATASFSGVVSANAGLATTTGSFSGLLSGSTATFSGIVSANAGIKATTATYSGKVSADAGLNTTIVSATTLNVTGDVQASTGTVTASAATITAKLTGSTAVFSGIVSADNTVAFAVAPTLAGSTATGTAGFVRQQSPTLLDPIVPGSTLAANFSMGTAVLTTITGFSIPVTGSAAYVARAVLATTSNTLAGVKLALSGSGVTMAAYNCETFAYNSGVLTQSSNKIFGNLEYASTTPTVAKVILELGFITNAGGTLTLQFAQNVSAGSTPSVVVSGSTFLVTRTA